jgi:hypothetical protein
MNAPRSRAWIALPLLLLLVTVGACAPQAERTDTPPGATADVRVTTIDLGRGIAADKQVSDPTNEFKPMDTIYASVVTEGTAPQATLKARWTFDSNGQVVQETEEVIAPAGREVTEFHVSKPDGWPEGKYKLEVFLNGASAATKDFEVKRG